MEFTRKARGAVGVWAAFMVFGVHQAVAGGDPPSPAVPAQPVKADTAVAAPAATPASATTVTEGAAPVATPASTTPEKETAARVPAVVVKSTLEDSVLTNDEVKRMLAEGYKQEKMSNGDILYCRKEDSLGSMVSKKHCVTGAQLKAMAEDKRQFEEFVQQKGGVNTRPGSPSASGP
jgi:hypothetical protein